MSNRMKEDEKHEKIIRGLLRLPENKRCINCNSLGPQYVCTNFWTFVCTTCSGIHREFTHRIKSVSMAKFTQEEVSALQRRGNEHAREVYFKEWNPQRHFAPDSSNVERLRTFIKHIYVDRKYTGEKSIDSHQKGNKESTTEFRRADTFHSVSRSFLFEDTYGHHHIKQSSPGGRNDERNFRYSYSSRSPGYDQGGQKHNAFEKSPCHFEVVDDRFRDDDKDRNGSKNRRSEDHRFSDRTLKPEGMSLKYQMDMDVSVPSIVRPVKGILGKNIPPLQVGESPKADGDRSKDGSATQRNSSSSVLKSTDANIVESKKADTGSLIDFDADPEPHARTAQGDPFTGESAQQQTMSMSVDSIWSLLSYDTQEKAPHSPKASTSESALSQLSAQAAAPVGKISQVSADVVDACVRAGDRGQCFTKKKNQPLSFTSADTSQSIVPQGLPQVGVPITQPWSSSRAPNAQGHLPARLKLPSQDAPNPTQEATAMAPSQAPPTEAKPAGRKELPADLFTVANSPAPAPAPFTGWHSAPSNGMSFGMQYSPATAMLIFTQPSKSANPFDLTSESTVADSPRFPSMSPLQGSLPNMAVHPALVHNSSIGTPSPPLLRTSSLGTPSPRMVPPHLPSNHTSAVFPSAYMMQHASGNIPPFRHQGIEGSSSEGNPFGINAMDLQPKARSNPQQASPNSLSSLGGNPFS